VARRFEEQWKRASQLQSDMVSSGMIEYVDDMEKAAIQLRTFIDKITTAPRGYSGLFDAVKINEKELEAIYQFDAAFFDLAEQVGRALITWKPAWATRSCTAGRHPQRHIAGALAVETYNRRSEAVTGRENKFMQCCEGQRPSNTGFDMWNEYLNVTTIDEALHALAEKGERARIVAGATDLILEIERGMFARGSNPDRCHAHSQSRPDHDR
jgi:hypothetical protein